jgi:hypothetical protein
VNRVRVTHALEIAAAGVAAIFVLAFGVIAAARLPFPFEISWSESAMGGAVAARMLGAPTYAVPSLFDGAAYLYPPLCTDLSALVARLLRVEGVSFLPMRLVSVASCAGIFIAALWVLRARKRLTWTMAFALAAIFPASYGRLEFWYDNARVDTLLVLLLFISTALLLEGESLWSAALAGVFGALATLTKQPGLVFMGLAGFHTVFVRRRYCRVAAFAIAFACSLLGYLWLTGDLLNPQFYFWMFKVAGGRPLLWASFVRGPLFLLAVLPFMVILAAAALIFRFTSHREISTTTTARPDWSWSLVFALWTLFSLIIRAKQGASINYFMPSLALAMAEGAQWIANRGLDGRRVAALVTLAQLCILVYNPRLFFPTAEAVKEASHLVETLRLLDGPIWFPSFPSYAAMAGKPWVAHYGTLTDLDAANPGPVADELSRAIRSRWFGALILHPNDPFVNMTELRQFYEERPFPEIHSPFLRRTFNLEFSAIFTRKRLTPL